MTVRRRPPPRAVLVLGRVLRRLQALPGLHHQAPAQPQRPQGGEETIMMMPPTNSLTANCHPISTTSTIPSSMTRLVEANMKTMAAM